MQQGQRCLVLAVDLGTSATTAQWALAVDSFNQQGVLQRKCFGRPVEMRAWRGARKGDAIGNICLPTDLVYDRTSRELLCMGFQAQQYLDDPSPEIARENVFVVEHIKLLLNNPDDAKVSPDTAARYRNMRDELARTLQKDPYEVFEDFLDAVIEEIIGAAKISIPFPLETSKLELALAFPSGWPELVHRKVAAIGARGVRKALEIHNLQRMTFGIQNVYTLSETLCGVKEWLTATIEEASISLDLGPQTSNLDELNEGDFFLPVDIGGGTGCLTPLRLVSKNPLRVDQLGPTQSLEVSGEAVEAEFERRLRQIVSPRDYNGDLERLIYQVCREFKEEKKNCGQPPRPGSPSWNIHTPRLRANPRKGFEKDCMKLSRVILEKCFDPALDRLDLAIEQVLAEYPAIKAIVFLGQFGGSSDYLRKRMARSPITNSVKLRHSQSGKLDVVKGAMSDRLKLTEKFVRKSETVKSYGTLISFPYYPDSEGQRLFPNAMQEGAVPLEQQYDTDTLKVVEWAISKGTTLEENLMDIGKDGRRYHTWPFNEKELGFENLIIVSDEIPPPPRDDGRSYTLWTKAHEDNNLVLNGKRLQVHQIPFAWDLAMSTKLDAHSNVIGCYETDDLTTLMWPEEKKKHRRRVKRRYLEHELVWNITEMQVKTFVRAIFPNPTGPLTMQLAKERPLGPHGLTYGESRSEALVKDIQVSAEEVVRVAPAAPAALPRQLTAKRRNNGQTVEQDEGLDDILGSNGRQLVNDLANEYRQPRAEVAQMTDHVQTVRPTPQMTSESHITQEARTTGTLGIPGPSRPAPQDGFSQLDESTDLIPRNELQLTSASASNLKMDGRRRDGCFTCKQRKKKCDCSFSFIDTTGSQTCNTCNHHGITCYMTEPDWANNPEQRRAYIDEQKRLLRLKRKSRDDSVSSGRTSRDRSATVRPTEFSMHQNSVLRSTEDEFTDHHRGSMDGQSVSPRKGMAIRGGRGGFKRPRQ